MKWMGIFESRVSRQETYVTEFECEKDEVEKKAINILAGLMGDDETYFYADSFFEEEGREETEYNYTIRVFPLPEGVMKVNPGPAWDIYYTEAVAESQFYRDSSELRRLQSDLDRFPEAEARLLPQIEELQAKTRKYINARTAY